MTCPLRHSGAERIFLGSVMPSVVRLLARFTQPAASLYGDPSDPGMPAYMAAAKKYSTPANAPDPWNIVNFGQMLTTIKIMNEVGYANLSPSAILAKAKAFTGPQALGAPALACGKYPSAPGVCNDRIQFFEYTGGVTSGKPEWTKAAGWLQPPS